MEDPAVRAEEMVEAYRDQFIGRAGPAARSVAHRFERTHGNNEPLLSIRGPFLQALDIPNWSERSWTDFCRDTNINPLIEDAFGELGFRRLYDFQEQATQEIKSGDDTVVTAATGRGKTEAWLIPILDRILDLKRSNEQQSVKALLIYPTKALAQDQFKRLVQYLYRINSKWPSTEQITIGIYDGDTPTNVGSEAHGYLESSFKYFDCPGRNEELEKCRNCGQGVRIHHAGQRYELQPEKRQCVDDVPLDFIRLTKHEILTEGVDILLTNPDTINRKLINVNAPDEHDAFVYDPEFLVFDEVHTYSGLFGSYTATLTKRLRALRAQRGVDELQVIASSATVANDVELFRKISGSQSITHVDENPRELAVPDIDGVPSELTVEQISEEDILAFARGDRELPLLDGIELDLEPSAHDDDRLRELIQDALFDHFTQNGTDGVVATVQQVHHELATDPRPRSDVLTFLQDEYALAEQAAEIALENIQTLGTFSGLLENRTHLFSWPIDGFYACTSCDAVYRSPQEECSSCGFEFVTRSTYCRGCADEALVAWYCPSCNQLEPYQPSSEGDQTDDDEHYCRRCQNAREATVRSHRVTFHPQLTCQACGHTERRSTRRDCPACEIQLVQTAPDTLACPNPACEATYGYQDGCSECGGSQRPRSGEGTLDCPECGETHEPDGGTRVECSCGTSLVQSRFIPWVCKNDDCSRTYFDDPPDACDCGSSYTFAKNGLFEIFEDQYCPDCKSAFVTGTSCDCASDLQDREGAHQSYKTFEPSGKIRSLSSFRPAAPCVHGSLRYEPGRRYDELVRGPGNLAVTTAQYMLRRVADEEGFESAKMLSFSDSHRDMKELDRDFTEPEVATLLDQSLFETASESETNWVPLADVLDGACETIDDLEQRFAPPQEIQNLSFDLKSELIDSARRHMDPEDALRDRLRRRAIPHRYSRKYREYNGSLAEGAIFDVRLAPELVEDCSEPETAVLRNLVQEGNDAPLPDVADISGASGFHQVDALDHRDVLRVEDDYVQFHPSAVEVCPAGDGDGLQYSVSDEDIVLTVASQLDIAPADAIPFETSVTELAETDHPRFTARAYRLLHSETQILLSRVYHGMTDKRERRELEYLFREGEYPHFLSSGPTMELGVDIGSLDSLLLYGTPPNMNAYLQRIGRAGRSSNQSLVHSVSKRNPIDYYYYEQPGELMAAEAQPVPLKEYNREVLRVSLTWAVFDYIAANFTIPWTVSQHGRYKSVSGGDQFYHNPPSREDETAKLTHVMSARTSALEFDDERSQFDSLGTIVHDYRRDIESYLGSLLDHQFCPVCSRRYDREEDVSVCEGPNCNGTVEDALTEFGDLASEAVDEFAERYLESYTTYLEGLEDELEGLKQQAREIEQQRRTASSDETSRQLRDEQDDLLDRRSALEDRIEEVKQLTYVEFLRMSRQSRYAFDMRTISESVAVALVDRDSDGELTTRAVGDDDGRSIRMAISELHPQAAFLDSGDTYVVSQLTTDEFESAELRDRVAAADETDLEQQYLCPGCHQTHATPDVACGCGSERNLVRQQLVVPESVTAHRADLPLANDRDTAQEIYAQPDADIQNTYAERDTDILSFDVAESFSVTTASGEEVGTLAYGTFSILVHASAYRAKYKNGQIDPEPTPFEACGAPNCPGIVYQDESGTARCSADMNHRPEGRDESQFFRLGYSYETEGIRVDLGDSDQTHVFAHGIRLALQYIGGVSIRDLSEVVHDESTAVDIFDSQEGGAGVAQLLVDQDTENFATAVEIMRDHFECDCSNGCPLCLYQYGCATRNRSDTFARDSVVDLLQADELQLK